MTKFKKIYVVGAGAVGCFFGGMLSRAQHNVTLIARLDRAQAIQLHGLEMQCQTFHETVPIQVSHDLSHLADADLILLCVKSPDTAKTMQAAAAFISKNAVVLSLQNGVTNVEIASQIIPNPVYPAVVYVACGMAGDRVMKHHGRGELLVGNVAQSSLQDSENLAEICQLFESADVPCKIAPHLLRDMWLKLLVNCSYNAISGIGQITYGEMVKVPEVVQLIEGIAQEFIKIAARKGIQINVQEALAANELIAKTMSTQVSSTAQDLQRGKKTEIDYLNGYIVRLGKEYEIPVPFNESIYAILKMVESKSLTKSVLR